MGADAQLLHLLGLQPELFQVLNFVLQQQEMINTADSYEHPKIR